MTPRSATSHKRTSSKTSARKAPSRQTSGKAASGKAASGKATSGKAAPRKAASGKAASSKAASGKAMSGKAMSDKAAPRKAAPRKATSHRAASDARHGTSWPRASAADPMTARKSSRPGTERARDEQRDEPTPRYGGGPWSVADERGDARFGHARNDDADPSELAPREAENDDESPSAADPELAAAEAAGEIESGGERAGMRRGEKPRKNKSREP
jgi:hypothetical protein